MTPDVHAHISGQAKQLPPNRIYGWRHTQMSIARHYGGLTIQGVRYVIDEGDIDQPLVKCSVLVAEKAERLISNAKRARDAMDKQLALI